MTRLSVPRLTRCRCGHTRDAHTHYRRGTGCAFCICLRFRRRWLTR